MPHAFKAPLVVSSQTELLLTLSSVPWLSQNNPSDLSLGRYQSVQLSPGHGLWGKFTFLCCCTIESISSCVCNLLIHMFLLSNFNYINLCWFISNAKPSKTIKPPKSRWKLIFFFLDFPSVALLKIVSLQVNLLVRGHLIQPGIVVLELTSSWLVTKCLKKRSAFSGGLQACLGTVKIGKTWGSNS